MVHSPDQCVPTSAFIIDLEGMNFKVQEGALSVPDTPWNAARKTTVMCENRSTGETWVTTPQPPSLDCSTVHVWRVGLDPGEATLKSVSSVLSAEEDVRAARFRFERHRRRFIVGRAVLRAIMGCYLDLPSKMVEFTYGPRGKPSVRQPGRKAICFNVSHSADLMVLAAGVDRDIGIDIEFVREMSDMDQVAENCFSETELTTYRALHEEERRQAFFRCWTRKEAYVKALGDGLSAPLDSFDVSLAPGQIPQFVNVRHDPAESSRWKMISFDPGPGAKGAMICLGSDWHPRFLDWPVGTA